MPPKIVDVPGVGIVEFPATMDDAAIEAVLRSTPAANAPTSQTPAELPWSEIPGDMARRAAGGIETLGNLAAQGAGFAEKAMLPAVGSVLGGAAGLPLAPFTVGTSVPVLSGAGGIVGLKLNEMLGIEQPTGLDYALTGGLPIAGAATGTLLKRLPGAAGGLQKLAVERAEGLPSAVTTTVGGQTADALYAQVRALNPRIPTAKIITALGDLQTGEASITKALKDTTIRKALAGVEQLVHPAPGVTATAVDYTLLEGNMKRLGSMITAAEQKGGDVGRVVKGLYKSMREAIDEAPSGVGGQAGELLAQANQSFRRGIAQDHVREALASGMGRETGLKNFDADAVIVKLFDKGKIAEDVKDLVNRDPGLASEFKGIQKTLTELSETPSLTNVNKVGLGTQSFAMRSLVGGALGGLAGTASGLGIGTGTAGGAGAVLAVEGISTLLMTAPGRAVISSLAKHGYTWEQIANVAAQAVRPTISAAATRRRP